MNGFLSFLSFHGLIVLMHVVPPILLVACLLRWRPRKHWTLALLTASLSLLVLALGLQWSDNLCFLSYWLGLLAQISASVGGVGIVVNTLRESAARRRSSRKALGTP